MAELLRVGLIGESFVEVTGEMCADALGSGSLPVYATPSLIALLEAASCTAIDPCLDAGRTTVGIEINVKHLSATPIGERVTAMAEVTRIEGKRIIFEVRAWDEHELVATGSHSRYLIDAEAFMSRLQHKDSSSADAS